MKTRIKKFLIISSLSVMSLLLMQGTSAFAAINQYAGFEHKTVQDVNVGQNKNISTNVTAFEDGYGPENMVDGNRNTPAAFQFEVDSYIQFDLNRSYNIKKIELYDRYDLDHDGARRNIKMELSNDPEFTESLVVGELGRLNTSKFQYQGCWRIEPDSTKAYRYIRITKVSEAAYCGYGELKVYADINVSEVSRDKKATANWWYQNCDYDWASPQEVLDGSEANMNSWICYKEGANATGYNWLQIDLGQAYKIGYLEMTARPGNAEGELTSYQAFDFYGSDFSVETDEQKEYLHQTGKTSEIIFAEESEGYHLLSRVLTADRFVNGFDSEDYPMSLTEPYCVATNDSQAYRYVTYKHTYPTLASFMGLLRLYVIHPNVAEINGEIGKCSVVFSEDMNFSGIEDKITLADSDGDTVAISNLVAEGAKVEFDAALDYGETYTVSVSGVENLDGVPLMQDYTGILRMPAPVKVDQVKFTADKECEGKKITSLKNRECFGVKAVVTNCTPNTIESAMLLVLLYNEQGECVKAEQSDVTIEPGEQKEVKVGMDVPSDAIYTAKAYVWRSLSDRTVWCLNNGI